MIYTYYSIMYIANQRANRGRRIVELVEMVANVLGSRPLSRGPGVGILKF